VQQYNKNPDQFNPKETLNLLDDFDQVLGLGLKNIKPEKIPAEIKKLADKREKFRKNKRLGSRRRPPRRPRGEAQIPQRWRTIPFSPSHINLMATN
jgi:hypothetical protein